MFDEEPHFLTIHASGSWGFGRFVGFRKLLERRRGKSFHKNRTFSRDRRGRFLRKFSWPQSSQNTKTAGGEIVACQVS